MSKKLFGKFFIFLLVVGLLFAVAPTGQAEAAIGVPTWVSQTPVAPTSIDTVLVLINQTTIEGENVGLEYFDGTTYTKIAASYDVADTYSGANWYATIPAHPVGTTVSYQLYMYYTDVNAGIAGTWSGFNWTYKVVDTSWYTGVGPYTISTVDQLAGLDALVTGGNNFAGKTINLSANLDLAGTTFAPIGTATNTFNGIFDGGNFTISNLTINSPVDFAGLFAKVSGGGSVKNLNMNNVSVQAYQYAGAVAGSVFTGSVSNVHVSDVNITSSHFGGGITGYSYGGFDNCSATNVTVQPVPEDTVEAGNKLGGIVGFMGEGAFVVQNCVATNVNISGIRDVGGIAGSAHQNNKFLNNRVVGGTVSAVDTLGTHADAWAGGVIGRLASTPVYLFNNTSTAIVSSYDAADAGQIIGGPVANAVWYNVMNTTQGTYFSTIQAAIDAAASGDVIEVAPGEYAEYVELRTPNITVRSTNGAAVTKIVTPPGTLTTGVKVLANMGTVTFDGFTVKNFTESGIIQGMAARTGTTFHVLNNIVEPYADYLRNGIQVSGDGSTVIGNTVYGKRLTEDWASTGITVVNASNVVVKNNTIIGGVTGIDNGIGLIAYNNDISNITIEGNTITGAFDGVNLQGDYWAATRYSISGVTIKSNIISDSSEGVGAYWLTDLTDLLVENNQFNNLVYGGLWIDDTVVGTVTGVDASPNWWGSAVGPDQTSADVDVYILGDPVDPAVYTPWCADAACENFAPDEGGNVYLSGTISGTGGILIGTPGLTYHLAADTVIQNNSPCFVIEASNTIILAEPGAKCIPTGGSNGIDVAAGLNNITIDGLEIDGTGQTTGDGIHFAGAVSNIVLVDNNIHDLDGDGIEFAGDVSEVVNIQGNMFKGNLGLGINNLGTKVVGAEYNSWGDVAGPTGTYGDGVNGPVTSTPFTHADLYVVSSGTPWANQVVNGQNITYAVMANLVNVNAADFYLEYPTNLTYVSHTDANALGINDEVTHDSATRKLHFIGYSTTGNKTGDLALFSVTFTANSTVLDAPLSFSYAATSGFGMVGYESSSNVFVNEMVNGSVTIIDLPTISSDDIDGYYLTTMEQGFSVTLDNPLTGGDYAGVLVDLVITDATLDDITSLYYWETALATPDWVLWTLTEDGSGNLIGTFGPPATGFPMTPDYLATTPFKVTFANPGSYQVELSLRDVATDTILATFNDTALVYDPATVTIAGDQYYIVDEPGAFTVTINNPTTGKNYDNTVVFDIVIADHVPADISALSCSMSGYTWDLLSSLTAVGSDVVARIEGADGFFTVPPTGVNMVVSCSVTYATAGNYVTSGEMVDVFDTVTPQQRVVSTNISATAVVYTAPVITATFPTGPYVAGEPVTVPISITNPGSIPGPFSLVLDLPAGTTIEYNGVTYTCTETGCPAIPVTLPIPTADLIITFPEGWTGDISMGLYDTSWDPDRLLATFTETGVTVLGAFDVNGTVSMQGRSARAGVPLTLTGTPGTYNTTSTSLISNNYVFEDVAEGTYTFTTNQPRYLNITADLGKTVTLNGAKTLSSLWMRGGNAVYTDNEVNDTDLGMVSLGYTEGITTYPDADVNFDNKINIQDLALVGGNYLLTSDDAYADWQP